MDNFVNEKDYKLLENDKYTFFVLSRIMNGKCNLLLSNHEDIIICFTENPYPVWIWTKDNISKDKMEYVYNLINQKGLLNYKYRFNLKYELYEYFVNRSKEDNIDINILVNMYAYDCINPIRPKDNVLGNIHLCVDNDKEEVINFLELFHNELGIDKKDDYFNDAKEFIEAKNTFFWENENGEFVASTRFVPNGDLASISFVYTKPQYRRMHYAENLVYEVTMLVSSKGYTPMLYTDSNYLASNKCYEKIGYKLQGKLCMIKIQ